MIEAVAKFLRVLEGPASAMAMSRKNFQFVTINCILACLLLGGFLRCCGAQGT